MVQCAARQISHRRTRALDRGGAGFVMKAQQAIGVGDVEVVANQGHAKRRIEVFDKGRAGFRDAVMVAVAQQADAVGAGHAGAGAVHDLAHHPAANALAVIGLGRGIGFGHQDIAIGQGVEPARVVQAFGKGRHLSAGRGLGRHTPGPADGRGDVDGGNQGLVGFGQLRRRADPVADLQARVLAATA
ncbi:hypothetical protein D3C76_1026930 [compost metagenome]